MKIINKILLLMISILLFSCFEDKGNYDYRGPVWITIENTDDVDSYSVLRGSEPLIINQKITTSEYGEVKDDNPNMEYSYMIYLKDKWIPFGEQGSMNLNLIIDSPAKSYDVWFRAIDKKSGYSQSKIYKVTVSSVTYEGWMVFGTEGNDNKSRLDMISVISETRNILSYDLMKTRGLPEETTGANCIGFHPNNSNGTVDNMYLFTDKLGYHIERDEFNTSDKSIINYSSFIIPTQLKDPVACYVFNTDNFIVTTDGDAFAQRIGTFGACFQDPINTTVRGKIEFKVAPFVGYNATRPTIRSGLAVFYDVTNKRFMGYNRLTPGPERLYPLVNPTTDVKFDYSTGMEMIYMVGTAYDGGVAFAVLKDNSNQFNIAAISIKSAITQHSYYPNIQAPDLNDAKHFAFHSKYPIMFYATGKKVYSYNWVTKQSNLVTEFSGSDITMIKFHLYANAAKLTKYNIPEFVDQQYDLIVASHNGEDNGGKLQFFRTESDYSITKTKEYDGFCKVKDVIYRERR